MKINHILAGWLMLAALFTLTLQPSTASAQGTAFTYQGRLNTNGSPASGSYDFRFKLYADPLGNNQVGTTQLTNAIPVTNGLFTTTIDFGAGIFTGSNCWLEVAVRTNGNGSYTALSPLQAVTPTPYAIMANSASNLLGTLQAGKLIGTVGNGQLANSAITVSAGTGLSGGGAVSLGGSTTLNNAGVLSLTGNGDITVSAASGAVTLGDTATSANTANTIVKRDNSGNFAAVTITAGSFSGSGANLTALNANNISGTLGLAQLPASVVTNGASGVNITGSFTGNGSGLTNLSVQNIAGYGAWVTNYAFGLASTPAVGKGPWSVAAFTNANRQWNLVCANQNDNTLTVLTNAGGGIFGSNATYTVGNNPLSVATFTNTYGINLVCANVGDGTLTVLTNNGSGIFGSNATYNVPFGSPPFVVSADVNGDGKPDLITAGGGYVTVFTNNGSGIFGTNATYVMPHQTQCAIAVDVNNDGKMDFVIACPADFHNQAGLVTVLTNNGSGGFAIASTPGVGANPFSLCALDINRAGLLDLVCANQFDGTLTVLTNAGNGIFGYNTTLTAIGNGASSVTAFTNANGQWNLAVANQSGSALTVLTNNGSGIFGSNATYTVGSAPICVIAADVNGDGLMDLISANEGDNTLTVLTNSATASYSVSGGGGGSSPTAANYVLSYSTNTQGVVLAGTFLDITNYTDAQLNGWTNANPSATNNGGTFSCAQTGLYLVQYSAEATTTTGLNPTNSVSVTAVVNGTEIAGSQATAGTYTANVVVQISRSFIASFNAGDILKFQLTGTSTSCRIVPNTGFGNTRPGFSCTIIRLQ